MAENLQHLWSDYDSSSRLGSAASFFGDSMSHSSGILTENSSLFSMSEDDFDQLATLKAREMFDEVDRILYENSEDGPLAITTECLEWKSKFPHLRIVGHKMFESTDHGFKIYSPADIMFGETNSNLSMFDHCSDLSDLLNGLTIRGEKMSAHQFDASLHGDGGGHVMMVGGTEEMIDHDGDYEEIFALDYNSDEKRSMYGSSRGYPPITPINSLRDFIVSSLSNKLLTGVAPHIVDLVCRCKARQASAAGDERSRDKENVKVYERSTPRIVLPTRQPPSPIRTRNNEESTTFNTHHINSRSFSFKPSDLQVVPEDSGLDAILTVRQMKSSRDASPLSTSRPDHGYHHLDHKSTSRMEHTKSKTLFPTNGMDSSPRASKTTDNGKTFSSNHRIDQWKQPLPRIQQKPLTASNNNIDGTQLPKNGMPQGLRTKDRVKSLPSVDCRSNNLRLITDPFESLTPILSAKLNNLEKVAKNFIQENIRKVSSRKSLKLQDSVDQTPRATSALHSGRDRFSMKQHLGSNPRFGDKLGYKFECGRPSSTKTYYNNNNNKFEFQLCVHSPTVSSSRTTLPELEEQKRLHSSDPSNKSRLLARRKSNLSSTMPQIHDNQAGRRKGTLPLKPRLNSIPFR